MYFECNTSEKELGMLYYLTSSQGTGGRLKSLAEDFVVIEIQTDKPIVENGKYTLADVTTKNWETNRLVRLLAKSMRISREKIKFAGTKDKRAITTQRMSFECEPSRLDFVNFKDIEITNIRQTNSPVKIGELIGNQFKIRVRNCTVDKNKLDETLESISTEIENNKGFPNYFGVQRFGASRPITHIVGEKIVRGDIKGAVETYLFQESPFEETELNEIRNQLKKMNGDYSNLDIELPKIMGYEIVLLEHLKKYPEDYKGSISKLPSNLQMMFTHAYQSYLFNQTISERMSRGYSLTKPIVGDTVIPKNNGVPAHDQPSIVNEKNIRLIEKQMEKGRVVIASTVFGSDGAFSEHEAGEIERKIIEKANISKEDFIVPGLQNCSAKGNWREIICDVNDLKYSRVEDDYEVSFSLTKGNYATCLMREFLKSEMNYY